MTTEEAVLYLRSRSECKDLVRGSYLGEAGEAAERFYRSDEFREVRRVLGARSRGVVLDVGAGSGIASFAFAKHGAAHVYALEPSPSSEIGCGAIARVTAGLPVTILDGFAENIPLDDATVDAVYARQVLHHTRDLRQAVRECARVLKPGGIFLGCREHVIKNEEELQQFLRDHPVHQLAGGENAYRLEEYIGAVQGAGLKLLRTIGPVASIINAYPFVNTAAELGALVRAVLRRRFGVAGTLAGYIPWVQGIVLQMLSEPKPWRSWAQPGRAYAFLARKPDPSRA